jgi:hypothetical protein
MPYRVTVERKDGTKFWVPEIYHTRTPQPGETVFPCGWLGTFLT